MNARGHLNICDPSYRGTCPDGTPIGTGDRLCIGDEPLKVVHSHAEQFSRALPCLHWQIDEYLIHDCMNETNFDSSILWHLLACGCQVPRYDCREYDVTPPDLASQSHKHLRFTSTEAKQFATQRVHAEDLPEPLESKVRKLTLLERRGWCLFRKITTLTIRL